MNHESGHVQSVPIERYEFPLSFAQQRLWFLDQLEGPSSVYTIRLPVRLSGKLNLDELQNAVDFVVARHESLRTTIDSRNGQPTQVIASRLGVPVQLHELLDTSAAAIHARVGELAAVPFDLVTGPLLRVHVLRIATDEHLLLLLCHHIVSDAWSSGVLFRDLACAYDALVAGEAPQLVELPVQYADYAIWQRDWLEGPELSRQLDFWRSALAGAPVETPLPTDRPRPQRQTCNGSRLTRVMPADLADALNALGREHSCTLFMVMLAALNVLLSRYTGQDDICVGSPIAGRRRTELEGLIGLFVNTLVLRNDLSGAPAFRELLVRVRRSVLATFAHQELPFEKLVEVLQPVRDQGRSPLFQTMFVLQNAPWDAQPIRGIDVEPGEAGPVDTAKFDLTVSAHEYEKELWVTFEYNTDLFDRETIESFAHSYERLLREIAKDPERSIHEFDFLSVDQRHDLVAAATGDAVDFSDSLTVQSLIADQANRTPNAIALEYEDRRWTYQKLDARTAALAECLVELLPDAASPFIAICTARAPVMMTAVLGVMQARAAYLPLDSAYPAERIRYMLADSGAGILVTQTGIVDSLPPFDGAIVLLTDDGRVAEIRMPVVRTGGDGVIADSSIAYLIYTSGSTGRPKGVVVPQRAVVNFLLSMMREPGIVAGDRLLAVTTLSFDISVLELLLPLTAGATVIIAPTTDAGDGHALGELVRDCAPTIMQATPATWRMLLSAGWQGSSNLRILCGGESLDAGLARTLLRSGRELWNMYGPTETTIWSACARIVDASAAVTIGGPIANTTIRVLDAAMGLVPAGVVGELYIGGQGLALGYHDRPNLTAECFVADPYIPGSRLYRTGDRARIRTDGRLELLGRVDRQVKLRGYRIELGEIEAALGNLAGVVTAAAVVSDERIVAYVVSAAKPIERDTNFGDTLRIKLRDQLPEFMVPSVVVELDELPLTPNGKVDRRRLPAPGIDRVATERVAPRGPLEAALARLFADILSLPDIGVTDNFFDIGGHSLLATQLVSRIRDVLAVEMPLRALFDEPSIAGLAGLLASDDAERRAVEFGDSANRLAPRDSNLRNLAPASLMQQRLWFLDQLEPGSSTYNLAWCMRLVGKLDRDALDSAVQAVVARHEILRTTFVDQEGAPMQRIADKLRIEVEYTQLQAATESESRSLLRDLARRPFTLETGPLMRVHAIATGAGECLFLVVIHHIVSDGWSLSVLFSELSAGYNAFRRDEIPELAPLPVQYADYSVWQRERLAGAETARQLRYWRAQLGDAPPFLELPTDRPRPVVQSHRGARVTRRLTRELTDAVNALAREEGSTLFMVLIATFASVLGRYAGAQDIVIGSPIAGRGHSDLEGLIGFFINTLALRFRFDENPTVRELLECTRTTALDAYAHQELPFEKLVDELRCERDFGRTPVFQVMFNLHNEPVRDATFDELAATPIGVDRGLAKFDLTVSVSEPSGDTERGLFVHLEYNADLFAEGTIVELADYYALLLETFAADPGLRLNSLPSFVTPKPDDRRDDEDWRGDIVSRFTAQARSAPKAIAVRTACSALSYGALDGQANAVAAHLLSLGLTPDPDVPRIGLVCGADTRLVAGLLGVLKAGCAWVPLDPAWPESRLASIVRDADLGAIVADPTLYARVRKFTSLQVVELDGETSPVEPAVAIDPDALACIIYTSGSTGEPKGVMQTHSGIMTQVGRYSRVLNIGAGDRLSGLSSYAYDASIQDIFGALLNGAAVYPYDVRAGDAQGTGQALVENAALVTAMVIDGITIVHAAPSLYRYLFGGELNCAHDLSALRLVVLGGEPVRRSDFELFRSRFAPGTRFVNGLGLTESTLALQFHADHDTRLIGQSVPIGDPVPGLDVELIDVNGQPGWIGELVLTGEGLSPGYWRQPEQTAERFGPGPVLRTGDICRRLPDGRIVYVGRRDEQLNIRGYRIEPGEIETALSELDGVSDCAVTAVERYGDPWLLAYVVAVPSHGRDAAALREALAGRVPAYMVPQSIEWLAELPRLPNGKVARDALPAPRFDRSAANVAVPARSELEVTLISIWAELLRQESIGVHDDFFALGGHSLLATRVVARVRDRLGVDVPLINLFEYPTIAGFAGSIMHLCDSESDPGPGDELVLVTR